MKYIVVLGDGMADLPIESLAGMTPMEAAAKPNIDEISKYSIQGVVNSIPEDMEPGSDVANLSLLGYDPKKYYTGRSSIEAASMGIILKDTDLALRTNLVTIECGNVYEESVMLDHGSDDIPSNEAYILMDAVKENFDKEGVCFHKGVSYRHLLLLSDMKDTFKLTPPHDIPGRNIQKYLPAGDGSDILLSMMKKSYFILSDHYINKERVQKGLHPANSIWFWGAGTKLTVPSFFKQTGLKGGVISAVDLINGIGRVSGMKVIKVEGADGTIDTNYDGKVQNCLKELSGGLDFVYLHLEAPDEFGHKGDHTGKKRAIELIDEKVIGPILRSKKDIGPFRLMFLPDHPTPVSIRTHSSAPVPFIIYDSEKKYDGKYGFYEKTASSTGLYVNEGYRLLQLFIR